MEAAQASRLKRSKFGTIFFRIAAVLPLSLLALSGPSCKRASIPTRAKPDENHVVSSQSKLLDPGSGSTTRDPKLEAVWAAFDRGDYASALRLTANARKRGASPAAILEMQAAIFKSTDYLDREIETLYRWTATAPSDPQPWLKLFYIFMDLGWRHEADLASKHCLDIAPENSRSHVARAVFYYRSASSELAIPYIAEARRRDPANPELAGLQQSILIKARHYAEAEVEARKSVAVSPQDTASQIALYHALAGKNKSSEAEALLRQIQQREPGNVEAAYELGGIAQKRGDPVEATRQFEKAAALDPGFNNVLWRLGRLYCQQGRASEGRKLLTTFETMDKNTADFETAQSRLRTRPDDAGIHFQLARYHLDADEFPQAIVELKQVLKLRPGDTAARKQLVSTLTRQGRLTEAREISGRSAAGLGLR